MDKKPKKPKTLTFIETYMRLRKGWGAVNPVTKIKPSKKKKSRAKNKRDFKRELKNEI